MPLRAHTRFRLVLSGGALACCWLLATLYSSIACFAGRLRHSFYSSQPFFINQNWQVEHAGRQIVLCLEGILMMNKHWKAVSFVVGTLLLVAPGLLAAREPKISNRCRALKSDLDNRVNIVRKRQDEELSRCRRDNGTNSDACRNLKERQKLELRDARDQRQAELDNCNPRLNRATIQPQQNTSCDRDDYRRGKGDCYTKEKYPEPSYKTPPKYPPKNPPSDPPVAHTPPKPRVDGGGHHRDSDGSGAQTANSSGSSHHHSDHSSGSSSSSGSSGSSGSSTSSSSLGSASSGSGSSSASNSSSSGSQSSSSSNSSSGSSNTPAAGPSYSPPAQSSAPSHSDSGASRPK